MRPSTMRSTRRARSDGMVMSAPVSWKIAVGEVEIELHGDVGTGRKNDGSWLSVSAIVV